MGMGAAEGELSYWEGWPRCPHPLCSAVCSLLFSSAKKGSLEDKDDISKLVTGLMKTSICWQMSYKTVEGNEVRTSLSPCTPLFREAGRMVIKPGISAGHPHIGPQHQLQPRGDSGGGDISQVCVPLHPGDDGQQL